MALLHVLDAASLRRSGSSIRMPLAVAALSALGALAARADTIFAGCDLMNTPAGGATNVTIPNLPLNFFGPGSDPFPGAVVNLMGLPLQGTPDMGPFAGYGLSGQADTIVARMADALVVCGGAPVTIPIEIVALSLVSVSPITVTFGGAPVLYEVAVSLSQMGPQAPGMMTITHSNIDGGTFMSTLPVAARFIFTRIAPGAPGLPMVTVDPITETLSTPAIGPGCWTHTPMGLPVMSSPAGGSVDHDADPSTPMIAYCATTNFVIAMCSIGGGCLGGGVPGKELTKEEAMLAKHGILPPNRPPGQHGGFGDGSMGNCPCGNNGAPGHGCQNSTNPQGALLFAEGNPSWAVDQAGGPESVVLRVIGMRQPSSACLFWQGDASVAVPFAAGDGLRFISGVLRRLGTKAPVAGKASLGALIGDPPITTSGLVPAAGGLRFYQTVYRDNDPGFCTPFTFNWTNMVGIPWTF